MATEEQKALELAMLPIKDVPINAGTVSLLQTYVLDMNDAKQAAIEAHEADKKAFSDAVKKAIEGCGHNGIMAGYIQAQFAPFILPEPEPDPLVEAVNEAWGWRNPHPDVTQNLRQALAARGYKIERIDNG